MRRYILKIEYDVGNGPMVRESAFYYDESKEDEIELPKVKENSDLSSESFMERLNALKNK